MKFVRLILVSLMLAAAARALEPNYAVFAPVIAGEEGAEVTVEMAVLNPHPSSIDVTLPNEIPATLSAAGRDRTVSLRRVSGQGVMTVPASGFARAPYRFRLPFTVSSEALLQIYEPMRLIAVLSVQPSGTVATTGDAARSSAPGNSSTNQSQGRSGFVPRPAAAQIERTFREHFGTHEPVYFIYGADDPGAKFQLSFKYRVFGDSADEPDRTRNSMQFGFTQRSLWDLAGDSSPFYDTSYMPEFFFEHLTPEDLDEPTAFKWLGLQAGYKHESNGRDGLNSRSMNLLTLRSAAVLGNIAGWRVILEPRVHTYIGDLSNNPDIKKYRGYGELRLILGKNEGVELMVTGRLGSAWEHPTIQADLTVPLRFKFGDFASFFLVQYFHGYGESFLNYRQETESLRGGFSFVR